MNVAWSANWPPPQQQPAKSTVDETLLKDKFAEALLRSPNDAFGVACQIFGSDTMRALEVSTSWPLDFYVLQKQADLIEAQGDEAFLPTKAELARRIFTVGDTATDPKDKLSAYKLYAEVRGFIVKADNVTNLQVNNNRVMVLRDFGSDAEWETKASKQQSKLIEHSRD